MHTKEQIEETLAKHPDAMASQGGGLVVWDEQQLSYIFVLPPTGYNVGDLMPEQWGTAPVGMALYEVDRGQNLTATAKLHKAMEEYGDYGWGF